MQRLRTVVAVLGAGVLAISCNPTVDNDRSAVTLSATLAGAQSAGKTPTTTTSGFFSDVVADDGTPVDDFLTFALRSIPKSSQDPTSTFYTIQLSGYRVTFSRSDGRNEPGVDVPFPLTLPISGEITPGSTARVDLLLITREMKLQQPLRGLWFGEGQRIFASANLVIFGRDLVENNVQAQGSALVVFGDFPG